MNTVHDNGPTLRVDPDSKRSVVEQIVAGLRQALTRGELQPGDRLPSSRALARDLGVHFNTVAEAYRVLEAEGWLALRRRIGTIVLARETPRPDADEQQTLEAQFTRDLDELLAHYQSRGLDRARLRILIKETAHEGGNDDHV